MGSQKSQTRLSDQTTTSEKWQKVVEQNGEMLFSKVLGENEKKKKRPNPWWAGIRSRASWKCVGLGSRDFVMGLGFS